MLKLELSNMAAYTALVEACDWDESQANAVIEIVSEFLDNLNPDKNATWEEFRSLIQSYISNIYGDLISGIIIDTLEAKADEVKFYTEIQDD